MDRGTDNAPLSIPNFFEFIFDLASGERSLDVETGGVLVLLGQIWVVVTLLAIVASIAALWIIIYSILRLQQVREIEKPRYATVRQEEEKERLEDSRWQHVRELIASNNENDWRQAVIEADIILNQLLMRLGYAGDSVGEKLKQVNQSHFGTLNNAWEAHKVRNEIAHQGSAYKVTDRLAYRAIANYEAVFREHDEI